jgi:surfeit locus 1 family protein
MRFGSLDFNPGLWPSLITLLLLGILTSLGFWQLDRAQQKRTLLADFAQERDATVIRLEAGIKGWESRQYQSASALGSYDAARQFLLDNRTHKGQVGYHVLTPFRLRDSEFAVLVNRGWIPIGQSRVQVPDPGASSAQREITGRIKQPSSKGFMLGEEEPRRGWPYRIQRIDLKKLAQELDYPLLPVVLLLDSQQDDGFVRDWQPVTFGPERNVGYAVQWFGLAVALLVIYVVVNTRRVE